jgi:Zn-finger nucleic acid-binding protein
MKCPNCGGDLVAAKRDSINVEACQACNGLWMTRQDVETLENEAYDLGKKGALVWDEEPSDRKCPQCDSTLQRFQYRDYDLQLEFCPSGHGYWLDAGEDRRILDLMKKEEGSLKRKFNAEDQWAFDLHHWRHPDLIDKVLSAIRDNIGGR